jgi:rare lipoprotein A
MMRVLYVAGFLMLPLISACALLRDNAAAPVVADTPVMTPSSPSKSPRPSEQAKLEPSEEGKAPAKEKPIAKLKLPQTGEASWYGPKFDGKVTASGDVFDKTEMTAAHGSLPFGTKVKVTNLANGKSVEVEIIDRGPFKENRIIDVSQAAAHALDMKEKGTTKVRLELADK